MDNYKLDARQLERKFVRFLQRSRCFLTVTGKENQLVSVSRDTLVLKTEVSKSPWSISRKKLRESIYFTFSRRTVIRKDLEEFSSYSSSLLGILFKCFEGIAYIKQLPSGLLRLTLKGVRVFFSGLERDPSIRQIVKEEGGSHLLLNYYYIRNNRFWTELLEHFSVVIDSGAYTTFKQGMKGVDNESSLFNVEDIPLITVEEYASFIHRYYKDSRILGFFNLDVIGDPKATKENYLRLKELVPEANIYPVWQFEDSIESFEELISEDHELLAIGGAIPYLSTRKGLVRRKFEKIFSKYPSINLHFLGGANEFLLDFPFLQLGHHRLLECPKI